MKDLFYKLEWFWLADKYLSQPIIHNSLKFKKDWPNFDEFVPKNKICIPTFSNTGGAGAGTGTTASDSKNTKKEFEEGRKKFEDLVNKVEGCTQIIEDPERCLVHDGDLVEIDITENTAIHRVHGYLTNDGFMVSIWKFMK